MRRIFRPVLLIGLLVFTGLLALATLLPAAETPVVLILPFEVSSPQRLDYLRETLLHLVAGRVGDGGRIIAVSPRRVMESPLARAGRPLTDQEGRDLAKSLGAHYVLFGRFTTVGEGFSIEGRLLDAASDREVDRVTVTGDRLANLMPPLGELANAVARTVAPAAPSPPAVAVTPPPAGAPAPAVGTQTPPAAGTQPAPPTAAPPGVAPPVVAAPVAPVPAAPPVSPDATWISRQLPLEIRGVGIGDVLGDGRNAIVVLARREVNVYRKEGNELKSVTGYSFDRSLEAVGVDVADVNGNGAAEIYVTAISPGGGLSSFVLEWGDRKLRPLATRVPWYLRVVDLTGGPALVGQRRGSDRAFDGPIRRLLWQGNKLEPGEDVRVPGLVSVYSFVVADLDGDGSREVASVQSRSPLTVYGTNGRVVARAAAAFGQTKLWVVAKPAQNGDQEEGIFLPARVVTVHLPGQGTRLLVSRNHEIFGVLDRVRMFSNGEVVGLRWAGGEVDEIGQTERFAYVADFQVGPLERGREPMLVVGAVVNFDGVLTGASSYLSVMPLRKVLSQ